MKMGWYLYGKKKGAGQVGSSSIQITKPQKNNLSSPSSACLGLNIPNVELLFSPA
jgi:hypothetical protein